VSILGGLELIEDIAPELGVAPSTLREWCRRGEFPHRRLPGKRRVFLSRADIEDYLNGAELETRLLSGGGRIVSPKKRPRKQFGVGA